MERKISQNIHYCPKYDYFVTLLLQLLADKQHQNPHVALELCRRKFPLKQQPGLGFLPSPFCDSMMPGPLMKTFHCTAGGEKKEAAVSYRNRQVPVPDAN